MRKYNINYIDSHDNKHKTVIYANSSEDALLRLQDCKTVLSSRDKGVIFEPPATAYKTMKWLRLSHRELADILRQLAYSDKAGTSAYLCITAMASTGTTKQIIFCNNLATAMNEGASLAEAFQRYEYMLPSAISPVIRASSESGNLYTVLMALAEQIENNIAITGKIKTALIYPIIILVVAFAVTWFLFTGIIPQVADVIVNIGNSSLPEMTLFIISVGEFLKANGMLLLLAFVAVVILFNFILTKRSSTIYSRFILRIPYVGQAVCYGELSKFYSHFSFLLQAGFVTESALSIAANVVDNKFMNKRLMEAHKYILKGYDIVDALRTSRLVPSLDLQLLQTGLASGALADVCQTLSLRLAEESDRRTQSLLKIMEPAIMLIVGVIVGIIMIAIYQPMFEMMTVF